MRIVLCTGGHWSSPLVYQAIRDLGVTHVIVEDGPAPTYIKTWRELLIQSYIHLMTPVMRQFSRERITELKARYPFCEDPIPDQRITRVVSLHDKKAERVIRHIRPDVIIVHEATEVDDRFLQEVNCPILSITPSLAKSQRHAYWGFHTHPSMKRVQICQRTKKGWSPLVSNVLYTGGTDNFSTFPYIYLETSLSMLREQLQKMSQQDTERRQEVQA
ncbi:hypothetical protein [Exiguobacterium qingdaonense]|uniref:hypothetical protein n=1 Tax=Exiguobacterium qingdaonense TaxID=2751251 RepID=UPI001BEC4A33|nr:hypothetical protein [Exiguobacterium qingdaonense]